MPPLLQLALLASTTVILAIIPPSSTFPSENGYPFEFRRVPRHSDSANFPPHKNLLSLQGNYGPYNSDTEQDLMPQAQSYFIEPELPTTTSVRPTFKRRKTLRPISTSESQRKKKELAQNIEEVSDRPEEPVRRKPFKPNRRPTGARTRGNANENANSASSVELNEIITTTEGQGGPTPSKPEGGFQPGRRKKVGAGFFPQVKYERPNRFQARRNVKPSVPTPVEVSSTVEPGLKSQSGGNSPSRGFRGGRQGFVLRPKSQGNEPSGNINNEERPVHRRRKKPAAEAAPQDDLSVQTTNENGQISESPSEASSPSEFQPKRNGFNRRPNLRSKPQAPIPSESETPSAQEGSAVSLMRRRPGNARLATPTDSVQESSDSVPVVSLTNPEEPVKTEAESPPADNYRPRNLSQRPNPLDKLMNRQASARRFLTPKNLQATTTAAPVVQISTKAGRRSPLSLQNLRNRRLGKPDATTTAAPAVETPEVPLNTNSTNSNETQADTAQPEFDAGSISPVVGDGTETAEPEVPKVEEAPVPKRPLLPGQRKPLNGRSPLLAKPKVTTTTAKPASEETTPTPVCEDGKRYNKVLRKCIPPFAPRSG